MPSFTTIFRAVVMLAVGAIVFKGWQQYGPSAEKVKSMAASTVDMAQSAWKSFQSPEKDEHPAADTRGGAPPFAPATHQLTGDVAIVPPALSTQALTPSPPIGSAPSTQSPITPVDATSPTANTSDERDQRLIARLEQLGVANPKVAPWGSSGRLFRCSCQAPLASSSAAMQHFESVAAEPALAVEQVVAKVEAWRVAQRRDAVPRYY